MLTRGAEGAFGYSGIADRLREAVVGNEDFASWDSMMMTSSLVQEVMIATISISAMAKQGLLELKKLLASTNWA